MNKLLMLFLAIGIFTFTACSDDNNNDDGSTSVKQLTKADYTSIGEELNLLEYNSENRLEYYTEKKDGIEKWKNKLEYNSKGELVKLTTYYQSVLSDYAEFVTRNDSLFVKRTIPSNPVPDNVLYDTIVLNSKGLLEKRIHYYGDVSQYEYDTNGNLTKVEYFSDDNFQYGYYYQYDKTAKNPFVNQNVPVWFWIYYGDDMEMYAGTHAPIKVTDEADNVEYQFSYTVDSDGYPVSVIYYGTTVNDVFTYRSISQ